MISFLAEYAKRYWKLYCFGFLALLLTNYIATLIPLYIRSAIDIFQGVGRETQVLGQIVWIIILLSVVLFVVRSFSRILIFKAGRMVEYDVRNKLYQKCLQLSPKFYRSQSVGDLLSRMINDVQSLRLLTALGFLHIANTTMIYVLVLIQMSRIDLKLTLISLLPIPFALGVVRLYVGRLHRLIAKNQSKLGELTQFFVSILSALPTIQLFVAEKPIAKQFDTVNQDYFSINIDLAKVRSQIFPFIGVVGSLGQLLLLFFGVKAIIQGRLSVGDYVAMTAYVGILAWPTASFAWILNVIQRGIVALDRIQVILHEVPEFQSNGVLSKIQDPPEIKVENLSFRYENESVETLSHLSFRVPSGTSLGIYGPVGSGKTTLINLLSRQETPVAGQILVDGTPIDQLGLDDLRSAMSVVSQDPFLFSESVRENIGYYRASPMDDSSDDQVIRGAKLANVDHDIGLFPDQYNTVVGERGIMVSGGQKSRISLARALIKPHQILIIDDVLAAVDHDTEAKLVEVLTQQPATRIWVSHRISALTGCDQIIVLDHGKIVDSGTHSELIKGDNLYSRAWQAQSKWGDL